MQSFENAENIFRERKKHLARGRTLAEEKCERKRSKKISLKQNIAETCSSRVGGISRVKWTNVGT